MMVDGQQDGPRNEAIARRLREEFGRLGGLSISEVARRIGMTQQALSQRMQLQVDFRVNELDAICESTGASFEYVTTGIRAVPSEPPQPPKPPAVPIKRSRGTARNLKALPRVDSNHQPSGYQPMAA